MLHLQEGAFPSYLCKASPSMLHTLVISDNNFSGVLNLSQCTGLLSIHVEVGRALLTGQQCNRMDVGRGCEVNDTDRWSCLSEQQQPK